MDLKLFLVVAVLSLSATEVLKGIIPAFFPKLKLGLVLSAILSLSFMIGWGSGIAQWFAAVDYASADFPMLFKYADVIATSFVLTTGSKGLNSILELLGVDLSGAVKIKAAKAEAQDKKLFEEYEGSEIG